MTPADPAPADPAPADPAPADPTHPDPTALDLTDLDLTDLDLTDLDLFVTNRHHRVLAWLRRHQPVYRNPSGKAGFWALTRYDDVLRGYRDHTTFSSSGGAILGGSFRTGGDSAAGRMLVASDPPRHRLLRQVIHPAFAPAIVDRVEAAVSELVERAFETMMSRGGADFATDIAPELPAGALMAMMGIGHDDAIELIGLTRKMIGFRDPAYVDTTDDERLRLAWIQSEIFEFLADLVRLRRATPGDDVVSMLIAAELNGRPMRDEDILYNCLNLAVGGNETSSYSACAGVEALITHPAQYDRLLAEPDLLDRAIDETLRWSSTNAYVQRVATRDVEIRGTLVRAGESVTLWNVSANRDDEQFANADQFDVARTPNRHVTFGSGIHRCIGAAVGQVELAAVLRRMIDQQVRLRLAGPVRRLRSNFILGITSLPVEVVG